MSTIQNKKASSGLEIAAILTIAGGCHCFHHSTRSKYEYNS